QYRAFVGVIVGGSVALRLMFLVTSTRYDFICCTRLACAKPGQSKLRCPHCARQLVGGLVKLFCCSAFVEKEISLRLQRAAIVVAPPAALATHQRKPGVPPASYGPTFAYAPLPKVI
ncbi:MAG: hypothetical protein IRA32_00610, partial [Xanthomonas citri pv. citri]